MTSLGSLLLSRSATNRDGERRTQPDLLERLWRDPDTRVLRVRRDGTAPVVVSGDGSTALDLVGPDDVAPALPDGPVVYLGRDPSEDSVEGGSAAEGDGDLQAPASRSYLVVEVPDDVDVSDGAGWPLRGEDERWVGLRDVAPDLDDRDAGLLVAAVGLLNWHRVHPHCPRCGARTAITAAGWTRTCPVDGSEHYPRTDPAVIMTVVDADDRVLLAHNAVWPERRFSTLAGFVEPGEPLEDAVRREVGEEVGVRVGDVVYRGSQPWPFPASLMLGFTAVATSTDIQVDHEEIAHARWFSRDELTAAVTGGEVLLPPVTSIARRLVEQWYGGQLPEQPGW